MRSRKRSVLTFGAALAGVALVAAACGSSSNSTSSNKSSSGSGSSGSSGNTASAPGITAKTIKIGFITSATGDASSTFSTSSIGAQAYVTALNKQGGIDGRQVQLVIKDDQSTPAGNLTATNDLIAQNVFLILDDSSFAFGGAQAAQKAGVPVVGGGFDGPEWGTQPYTNMFSIGGSMDPAHSELQAVVTSVAFFKYLGVKTAGGLAYGISPSSISSIKDMAVAMSDAGMKMSYENLSLPFGTTNVTSVVLALKQANPDIAVCSCVQSTVLSLVTGMKQAGMTAKSLSLASADSTLFSDPNAASAAQGVYYSSIIPPLDTNNAASTTFENNIKAVDSSYQMGTYPTFGIVDAYLEAALAYQGFQVAGKNPTRQSYISGLSKVDNWTADGLIPFPVGFTNFGHSLSKYCSYYVTVKGQSFSSLNGGKALCGNVPSNLSS